MIGVDEDPCVMILFMSCHSPFISPLSARCFVPSREQPIIHEITTSIRQPSEGGSTLTGARLHEHTSIIGLSHAIGLKVLNESPSQKSVRKSVTVGSLVRCDSSFGAVSSPPLWYPTNVLQQAAKKKTAGAL